VAKVVDDWVVMVESGGAIVVFAHIGSLTTMSSGAWLGARLSWVDDGSQARGQRTTTRRWS
jgi:hypothetical protein